MKGEMGQRQFSRLQSRAASLTCVELAWQQDAHVTYYYISHEVFRRCYQDLQCSSAGIHL
jgi:hypothetical protein